MELLPQLLDVSVVDLHALIIKNGNLLLGTGYKHVSIEHGNGEFTKLSKLSNSTIMQLHCPTSLEMNKWWADTNVYNSSIKVYTVDGNQQAVC